MRVLIFILSICLFGISLSAQPDSSWQQPPSLSISAFADVYYAYDLNEPTGGNRLGFLYNHNRHNEFNLNLSLIQFHIDHAKYRANLGFQSGTYANDNYAAEQGIMQTLFEANVGISLDKANKLWLDAGIMPSHLGFESAISMDNLTLTRSLLAENSPYFLSGAKLTYTPNDQWEFAGLAVNGWQRIRRLPGNSMLSYGTQLTFSPSAKTSLNWSTFIGTDDPDSTRRMRYFSNLYWQFQLSDDIQLITALDFGQQQKAKGSSDYDQWYSPIIILQYAIKEEWKIAFRAEYYEDETGIIISTGTFNGFKTSGFSINLDYVPTQAVNCRIEGRWLESQDAIFRDGNDIITTDVFFAASIAIRIDELLIGKR